MWKAASGLRIYLLDASLMPRFARKCLCKPLGKCLFCFIWGKKSGTERERVGVVVFATRSEHVEFFAAHIFLYARLVHSRARSGRP